MNKKISWIAVDWGTQNLRAWAMSCEGDVLDDITCNLGTAPLTSNELETALKTALRPWFRDGPMPVVACGIINSYPNTAPCKVPVGVQRGMICNDQFIVHTIGGIQQSGPADLMCGAETKIAGFLTLNPDWDGVICLPGLHTKWVHISANEIVSFQTFMTCQVLGLLSDKTVLKTALGTTWDHDIFTQSINDAMSRPEAVTARLFSLHAENTLNGPNVLYASSRLWGLMIGAELSASRPYWLGQSVAVIGPDQFSDRYICALESQYVPTIQADDTQMTLAGLKAAYRQL